MKTVLLFFIVNIYGSNCLPVFRSFNTQSNLQTIENYLRAKERSLQENATKEDVEKMLDFYSDTLYYEHVLSSEKKFIFHGKDELRDGYISHLGETRNVKIKLIKTIEKQNIIVAEYSIKREILSGNKIEDSKIVSFFEFDREGKIKRIIDYL